MKSTGTLVSRALNSLCALTLISSVIMPKEGMAHAGPHGGSDNSPEPSGVSPFTVLATGLSNPRSILIVDDEGSPTIYIAEAGRGGEGPCVTSVNGDYHDCYGPTGSITCIAYGRAKRVMVGLPSIAGPNRGFAIGPSHIVLQHQSLFVSFSNYGSPEQRAIFSEVDSRLGKILKVPGFHYHHPRGGCTGERDGKNDGTKSLADLSDFEDQYNPDNDQHLESNPSGLAPGNREHLLYAVDSGANDLLQIMPSGDVSLRYVFPTRDFTAPSELGLPPGATIPVQSVPTAVIKGPDNAHYVAEFTGFPYPKGAARVLRFGDDGIPAVHAAGFTNIIDITFGPDGSLYVLEMAHNGLLSQDVTGAVTKIEPNGKRTLLASKGLAYPTAIAVDRQGNVYVTNYGTSGSNAQLVRF